jgi:hypothetical protein
MLYGLYEYSETLVISSHGTRVSKLFFCVYDPRSGQRLAVMILKHDDSCFKISAFD